MKKVFKFLLALTLAFTSLGITREVKAAENYYVINSFGLENHLDVVEINSNDEIAVNMQISSDLFDKEGISVVNEGFAVVYLTNTNEVVNGYLIDGKLSFPSDFKYKYETLEFLGISTFIIYKDSEENYPLISNFYSSKDYQTLKGYASSTCTYDDEEGAVGCNIFNNFEENELVYLEMKDFTVKFTDYAFDDSIPNITKIDIVQNGTDLTMTLSFDKPEISGFIDDIVWVDYDGYFEGQHSYFYVYFKDFKLIDEETNTYQVTSTTNSVGGNNIYGTYSNIGFTLNDKAGNNKYFYFTKDNLPEGSKVDFVWDETSNPLETAPESEFYTRKITTRANGKFTLLKEDMGYGGVYLKDDWGILAYATNMNEAEQLLQSYNLKQAQTITIPLTFEIPINSGKTRSITVNQEIELIEVKGTVDIPERIVQVSLKYSDVYDENGFIKYDYIYPTIVTLKDGTKDVVYAQIGQGEFEEGVSQGIFYVEFGGSYDLPTLDYDIPKEIADELQEERFYSRYHVFLIDDDGNLVDKAGNILKKKADREEVTYETKNDAVNVSSLEGTVPSYTTVNAEPVNVDNLFDGESIAYDIELEANYTTIQPVETVDVTINLPENMQGQDLDVYYVDDIGDAYVVNDYTVNDDGTVTFTTDHFSTYAVVANELETPEEPKEQQTPLFKEFEIKGLTDKVNVGDKFEVVMKPAKEFTYLCTTLVFETPLGERSFELYYGDQKEDGTYRTTFEITDLMGFDVDKYELMYVKNYYFNAKEQIPPIEYYDYNSSYTLEELNQMGYPFESYNFFGLDKAYAFEIKDAELDRTAPTVENLEIKQDGSKVTIQFETNENQSGIDNVQFDFYDEVTAQSLRVSAYAYREDLKIEGNKVTYELDLAGDIYNNYYLNYPYGEYKLESISIVDKLGNYEDIEEFNKSKIALDKKDNVLETLTKEDIQIYTNYENNELFFRTETGVGSPTITFNYLDGKELKEYILVEFDKESVDLTKATSTPFIKQVAIPVVRNYEDTNKETVETWKFDIKVNVVDVIGTVASTDQPKEVSMTWEDYQSRKMLDTAEITVQLKDGTYEKVTVKTSGGIDGFGTANDGSAGIEEGKYYYYNPKYQSTKNENPDAHLLVSRQVTLIDKDGNLVDFDGNVRVLLEDRKVKEYKTNNTSVNVTSLEGTVPSYTTVEAKEEKLNVFDEDYIAYDITLMADHFAIQPVETVDVTIDLPKDMQGKEVEVYYVDDEGNKELVEGSTVNKEGTVTFTTDHFSTYAVVAKDTSEETPGTAIPEPEINTEVEKLPVIDTTKPVEEVTVGTTETAKEIINDTVKEIIENVKTDKEVTNVSKEVVEVIKEQYEKGNDVDLITEVVVKAVEEKDVTKETIKLVTETLKGSEVVQYLDLSVLVSVVVDDKVLATGAITELSKPVTFTIALPDDIASVEEGYERTYYVIREHEGKTDKLPVTVNKDGSLTFTTDKFSTYALVYVDTKVEDTTKPETTPEVKPEVKPETKPITPETSDNSHVIVFAFVALLSLVVFFVFKKKEELSK